jgi:hypothetical protein
MVGADTESHNTLEKNYKNFFVFNEKKCLPLTFANCPNPQNELLIF